MTTTKLVSIHANRAGTGKTTLAVNLAARLAAQGRRVGLVDADLYAPGLHRFFYPPEQRPSIEQTLNYYVWHEVTVLDQIVHLVEHPALPEPLRFVPASPRVDDIMRAWHEGYDHMLFRTALWEMGNQHELDYVFIDTAPSLNPHSLLTAVQSDVVLITLRTNAQDWEGTRLVADALERVEDAAVYAVINNLPDYESNSAEDIRAGAIVDFHYQVAAIIPHLPELHRLADRDIYVLHENPDGHWLRSIDAILDRVEAAPLRPAARKH
ncbi:MAG: tyrosine-protein kinase family protein [Anaerolineae bacterium]|nr:tyrosine-protein kinase family protein [Anaerolineae bacterium]